MREELSVFLEKQQDREKKARRRTGPVSYHFWNINWCHKCCYLGSFLR